MESGALFPNGVSDWKAVALSAPLTYSCSWLPVQTQARWYSVPAARATEEETVFDDAPLPITHSTRLPEFTSSA